MSICQRHSSVNLGGMSFRIVASDADMKNVFDCRYRGYGKYFSTRDECTDEFDEKAVHYLCLDAKYENVLSTLRTLSRREGPLEIEKYLDISAFLENGIEAAEVTRFSIPHTKRSRAIKLGLWKFVWLDILRRGHSHLIVWVRKGARRDYEALMFEDLPGNNTFKHPLLGGLTHYAMSLDLRNAPERFRSVNHPLYAFFCEERHQSVIHQERSLVHERG